jgi:MFS family permease
MGNRPLNAADAGPAVVKTGRRKRAEYFTYAAGLLTDSQGELISFIIPLWGILLGLGPLEIGILVSAKAVLPTILAIHGGVLMDRFGTRAVLVLLGAACTLMPPFFATATWFPALLLLQMVLGMVLSLTWMGSQALVVFIGKDDPAIMGRFAFCARIGVMIAPLVAGALWDFTSPWVVFVLTGLTGAGFWLAIYALPPAELGEASDSPGDGTASSRPPFRIADIMPRLSDYIGAIGLLSIPAVAFVVVVSSVRLSTGTLLTSFYLVYLKEIGLQATMIGGFMTITQMMAAVGTLLAARLTGVVHPVWAFLGLVTISVFLIYSTPIYGDVLLLLAAVIAIRGIAQGASQPIMYGILSRAVGPEIQATAIGLRSTGNRVMALILPVLMGAIAEVWGLNATFYVTGGILLLILAVLGIWIGIRHPETARR